MRLGGRYELPLGGALYRKYEASLLRAEADEIFSFILSLTFNYGV